MLLSMPSAALIVIVLLAAVVPVAGALFHPAHWAGVRKHWKEFGVFRNFWADQTGVVTVSYFIRSFQGVTILGSATPPTAQQAQQVQMQKAQVAMADADTQALFTHNWGLDASAPGYFDPEIFYYSQGPNNPTAQTSLTGLTFDVSNTNVVKVNKLNFLGTGGTWIVCLRKAHQVGQ